MSNTIKVISPGRTCLFGDHQDYLGLPVIACAIDKYINLTATQNETNLFKIRLPDISEEKIINVDQQFEKINQRDYFASSLKVLRRYGCIPNQGYDVLIKGDLPINAGVSSSSALIVAWVRFLLEAFGADHEINSLLVFKIAYEAEVIEHGEPGGVMDQYTIGVGGVLFIETGEKTSHEVVGEFIEGLIVGESGIKKETIGTLGDRKTKALKAIEEVIRMDKGFDLKTAPLEQYDAKKKYVSEELRPYFFAALKNHSITLKALKEFKGGNPDMKYIGDLMNQHHSVLKDILKITVPRIDNMVSSAIKAGAYGVKIVGSGGGGSIVAIAPESKQQDVIKAIVEGGGKDAYLVKVDSGARVIK